MKVYMLTIYIIHVECDDIMLIICNKMLHVTSFMQLMKF
jgi:hypothetical protein